MDDAAAVDALEEVFAELVGSLKTEADEPHLHLAGDLEARISHAEFLELLGETNVATNVSLEILNTVKTQHKPKLERSEATTERNLPVTVVRSASLLVVLEIKWIDIESVHDPVGVLQPHRRAIKVDEQPLVWIEVERFSGLDALHEMTVLGTDES